MKTSTARKLTYDDFVRFPDDGRRHELDVGIKRKLFDRAGVQEYWVVDADSLTSDRLPGLSLEIQKLFR